jgi:dTDP-4-amino-4,6-dideoxygalactose transaminase
MVAMVGPVARRIYLSAPCVSEAERALLLESFDSGWIAPLGPHVDAFEADFARYHGVSDAAALASGTAALHLALHMLGVGPGDDVLVSSLTFVATANAIKYCGAAPVFVDSELGSWNLDPQLVDEYLRRAARAGKLPKAVVAVDVLGQCADYTPLRRSCDEFGVPLVEDAAEALGATYGTAKAGTLGDFGVFSFNGNKIVTTSGGGMLICKKPEHATRARYLAAQARLPTLHYEHEELGFNYRLSGLLAAVGRAQLQRLDGFVARRRELFGRYERALANAAGVEFMPEASFGRATRWLTCLTLGDGARADVRRVIEALSAHDIEARPVWKPLHLQSCFRGAAVLRGEVSERIFRQGLCLPSGSGLSDAEQDRVIACLIDELA